jgi:hypothetical protein
MRGTQSARNLLRRGRLRWCGRAPRSGPRGPRRADGRAPAAPRHGRPTSRVNGATRYEAMPPRCGLGAFPEARGPGCRLRFQSGTQPREVDIRSGAEKRKGSMMTDVACFCGCLFSFDGDAGACSTCGRVASVTAGPVLERPGHNRPKHPVPVMNGAGQDGQTRATCLEPVEVGALPGVAIDAADTVPGRSESAESVLTSLGLLSRHVNGLGFRA